MLKLRPIRNDVVISLHPVEEKSPGGVVLPSSAALVRKGEVLSVGPGRMMENGQREAIDVKKGDVVYVEKYQHNDAKTFKDNGREIAVVDYHEIIAIVESPS